MSIWLLISIGVVLLIIAIAGSLLPGLPGPPLAYGALFLGFLNDESTIKLATNNYLWLIILGIITMFITVIDYYMPVWGTKRFGGTPAGARGSTIGLIVGIILSFYTFAFSIVLGPLVGAYIGEKNAGQSQAVAVKSAFGSFLGFISGTLMKIVIVLIIGIYFVYLFI